MKKKKRRMRKNKRTRKKKIKTTRKIIGKKKRKRVSFLGFFFSCVLFYGIFYFLVVKDCVFLVECLSKVRRFKCVWSVFGKLEIKLLFDAKALVIFLLPYCSNKPIPFLGSIVEKCNISNYFKKFNYFQNFN
jgi:hypothetical protein